MANKLFLNGKEPETNNTNNTIKLKNNKTKNLILNSGKSSTIDSPSETSLRGIRDASASSSKSEWVDEYYRETAANLKAGAEPFYVSVSVKGFKSNRKRRQVNIDVVPHSGAKPMHLKSCTVAKTLKWELMRDIPQADKKNVCWEYASYSLLENPDIAMAGKIVTRQKYRNAKTGYSPIPIFTIGNCSLVTFDEGNTVRAQLTFGDTGIEVICEPLPSDASGAEWFMYRGDYKKPEDMEIV